MRLLIISIILISGQVMATGEEGRRPMTVVDLIDVPGISGLQISPKGNQLLYVKSEADWHANKIMSHIWRVDLETGTEIQMTNGENGESSPVWSPDATQIAFVARRDTQEHNQIYAMYNFGGEARRLSEHPEAVSRLSWSPDGERIYFVAVDEKSEEEKEREERSDNVYRFDEDKRNRHVWRLDVSSGEITRVTEGGFSIRGYGLSADGEMILYSRAPGPLLDDGQRSELWLANWDGSEARQLTDNSIAESSFQLSPDNERVLFRANTDDDAEGFYYNDRLFVVSAEGGEPECVVCGGELDVDAARWSSTGSEIFFRARQGVRSNLYRLDTADGRLEEFTKGDHTLMLWDYEPRADLHAFSFSSERNPGDVFVSPARKPELERVTHLFEYLDEQFFLPGIKAISYPGADGVVVEGLIYLPHDFEEGVRYPLIVQTHGGPASSDTFRFPRSHNYESVLTGMGYVVFKPNYRGSTGYGDEFLRDMVGHYFNQAHKDVVAGVDYLISQGIVDGDRMGKMGWSAGGHMTNKIITYTDRFKAASSGAGAVNWISMYGQSDTRVYRTPWFGGNPWSDNAPLDQYRADSPLFDLHDVTTPTIILVGENDARVPMPQSVELYRALKHLGVPTHLYVAPEQGHGWRELQQRLFKANVELDWFERWVRGLDYEWEDSPV